MAMRRFALLGSCLAASAALAAGCGGAGGGTRITADGSSTVGPFTTVAAEGFRKEAGGAEVTVGISGTGGGFERFCAGETDLSDASRPIEQDEAARCRDNGIDYVEFQVANDALTVVVNRSNDWATCLTVAQLKRMWEPGSGVSSWRQVEAGFPEVPLKLYGPGTDSGTFDYFTEAVVGDEGKSRSDYQASEDDNVLVQGVAGERGGLGYFGFSYFEENQDKLRAVAIDGGDGCVEPTPRAAQSGSYKPLSRPLFIYAKKASFERKEVEDFIRYILDRERELAEAARFVPLTDAQLAQARGDFEQALQEVGAGS